MCYCAICGEDVSSKPIRFWSPDDGYVIGRLCSYCEPWAKGAKPKPTDYAYDRRDDYVADQDAAIAVMFG